MEFRERLPLPLRVLAFAIVVTSTLSLFDAFGSDLACDLLNAISSLLMGALLIATGWWRGFSPGDAAMGGKGKVFIGIGSLCAIIAAARLLSILISL